MESALKIKSILIFIIIVIIIMFAVSVIFKLQADFSSTASNKCIVAVWLDGLLFLFGGDCTKYSVFGAS